MTLPLPPRKNCIFYQMIVCHKNGVVFSKIWWCICSIDSGQHKQCFLLRIFLTKIEASWALLSRLYSAFMAPISKTGNVTGYFVVHVRIYKFLASLTTRYKNQSLSQERIVYFILPTHHHRIKKCHVVSNFSIYSYLVQPLKVPWNCQSVVWV